MKRGLLAAFVGMVEGLDDPADDLKISPKANALALFNPVFDNGPEGQGHGFFNPGKGGKEQFFYETLRATDKFLTSLGWLKGEPTLKKLGEAK